MPKKTLDSLANAADKAYQVAMPILFVGSIFALAALITLFLVGDSKP